MAFCLFLDFLENVFGKAGGWGVVGDADDAVVEAGWLL